MNHRFEDRFPFQTCHAGIPMFMTKPSGRSYVSPSEKPTRHRDLPQPYSQLKWPLSAGFSLKTSCHVRRLMIKVKYKKLQVSGLQNHLG